jgi:hypothetical protein
LRVACRHSHSWLCLTSESSDSLSSKVFMGLIPRTTLMAKGSCAPSQIRIHAGKVFTGLIGCVPGQIFVGYFDPSLHLNMFSEWGFANFIIASVIVSNEVDLMTMNWIIRQIISVEVWGGFSPCQVSEQNNTTRAVVKRSWDQNNIILHGSLSLGTKRENCCGV